MNYYACRFVTLNMKFDEKNYLSYIKSLKLSSKNYFPPVKSQAKTKLPKCFSFQRCKNMMYSSEQRPTK